jgi:hypothetical protein
MTTNDAVLDPEREKQIAAARSLFGIRPGTSFTGSPEIFSVLSEEERPSFTFKYMSATQRARYQEEIGDVLKGLDGALEGQERLSAAARILAENRKITRKIHEWVVRETLTSMTYRDGRTGELIELTLEAGIVSQQTWDAIDMQLRGLLAELVLDKNFPNSIEQAGVKS